MASTSRIEFDAKFGVKTYKNVRFSLADRSKNNYPILIGKDFLKTTKHSVNVDKTFTLFESILDGAFEREMAKLPI